MKRYISKAKINNIVESVDVKTIIAEAKLISAEIVLVVGKIEDEIVWSSDTVPLSYSYSLSCDIIHKCINLNKKSVIKIVVFSKNCLIPINRNIIIYVPVKYDLEKIRNKYKKYGDILKI